MPTVPPMRSSAWTADEAPAVQAPQRELPGRREAILALLRSASHPRTILELADEIQVHANTVRFHLEALRRAGQVEQLSGPTGGVGRPPVLFRATRRMDPDGPTNYRLLAAMLASHLAASSRDPVATAAELGRTWGPQLINTSDDERPRRRPVHRGEALTQMIGVLGDLGFAPEPPTGPRDQTIRLRHCPFLGLVADRADRGADRADRGADGGAKGGRPVSGDGYRAVICSVHLGLMQGALASWQSPIAVDRLEPFVEPDLCVARLAPTPTPRKSQAGSDRSGGNPPSRSGR